MPVKIREGEEKDCRELTQLVAQLGYEITEDALIEDLRKCRGSDNEVLVAEAEGTIVGFVAVNVSRPFHRVSPWGRVSALVVDGQVRRHGVGVLLLKEAEGCLKDLGCSRIELTSSVARDDAHRFYESCGYREMRKRFVKIPER